MDIKSRLAATCAIALIAASVTCLHAQPVKVNKKFDKVSKAEVEMQSYAPDTTAAAVVLLDVGRTEITFDPEGRLCLKTEHHERIKVLKEDGVSYGDYEFVYYNKPGAQDKISGVRVTTYNMDNGNIVRTKMSRNYIFDEEFTDNYRKLSFSAQDVRKGSVIEVEYYITSYSFLDFDKVYFQRTIPVNLFEYEVHIPEFAKAGKRVSGYNMIKYESDEVNKTYTVIGHTLAFRTKIDFYCGQELPAMKKEPYSYGFRPYLSAVDYDINSLEIPGVLSQYFSVKWEDVDKNYYESSITSRMNDKCLFPDGTKKIMETENADADKIMAIRDMVRSEISWNGIYRLFPKRGSQIYKDRTGSNADINAIIASCLRAAGYRAEAVLIKMRTSGILLPAMPEMNPYDTFILRIETASGNVYYLDGGSDNLYLNVLPPEMLVAHGRLLRSPGQCQWLDLTNLAKNSAVYLVNAKLGEDGTITGSITAKYTGEESYEFKKTVRKAGSEEDYIGTFENMCSINAEEYKFRNMDRMSNDCVLICKFEKDADRAGNLIYINPFLMKLHSVTDFSPETRTCPVEFPYPTTISYVFGLELPENYRAENLPENIMTGLSTPKAICKMSYSSHENKIMAAYNFVMTETIAPVEGYQEIREFWQNLCGIYDETIVVSVKED